MDSGLPHTKTTVCEGEGLRKFSDDSAAVGLITDGDDTEYRELIQDFVDWSLRNNLQINTDKTKELVVISAGATTPACTSEHPGNGC
ncbi:hypothetical protein D4764_0220220 [Takifugu flavidus]|uniref:Reverse transcriptase domain-containing protein n=1 Tax=Takifugu flavidus TaxID=433684 RepID=A0A5C6MEH5_9TELE|nr:hypothetical protein D4764_0220220 [Takifugu flavidus]